VSAIMVAPQMAAGKSDRVGLPARLGASALVPPLCRRATRSRSSGNTCWTMAS
jgi:hypothetical protein